MLREFLSLILPPEGRYFAWADTKSTRHFDSLDALTQHFQDPGDRNDYFALAAFNADATQRKSEFARAFRSLYLDIDCGVSKKGTPRDYPTHREALQALIAFCRQTQLPLPLIVNSGFGIHAYWPLTEEIVPHTWQSLQHILKHVAAHCDLKVDPAALTKLTQVSRPIQTRNIRPNGERWVTLIGKFRKANDTKTLEAQLHTLASKYRYTPNPPKPELTRREESKWSLHTTWPPAQANLIEERCGQVQYALRNPNNVSYDYWFSLIGVAKFCAAPEETAKHWSKGYAGYTESETEAKVASWAVGPTLCKTLQQVGKANICESCPLRERVISPVQTGLSHDKHDTTPHDIELRNYRRTENQGIIRVHPDGTEDTLSPYNVGISEIIWNESELTEYVVLEWQGLNASDRTIRKAMIPYHTIAPSHPAVVESFNRLGITTVRGKLEAQDLAMFLSEYKLELERKRFRPAFYDTMGWKQNNEHFVLGPKLIRAEGVEEIKYTKQLSSDLLHGVSEKGTLEEWVAMTKLFDAPELHAHAFVFLCAFGSPLLSLMGYGGAVVNMVGPSGAGKSTVGAAILSMLGNPQLLDIKANATANAFFNHCATLQNLPIYLDDISNWNGSQLSDLCYYMTFGEERRRLNQKGDSKESRRWSTMAISSSNNPMSDKLISNRTNSEAEMLRLFELHVARTEQFEHEQHGEKIHALIAKNYGVAAPVYFEFLVRNLSTVVGMLEKGEAFIEKNFNFKFAGQERFWKAIFVCNLVGGLLAEKLNLVKFDVRLSIILALEQLRASRTTLAMNNNTSADIVASFVAEHINQINYVRIQEGATVPIELRRASTQLRGLIEVHSNRQLRLYIDAKYFMSWMVHQGFASQQVKRDLRMAQAATSKDVRKQLDPIVGAAMLPCIEIDLSHVIFHELRGYLEIAA